MWSGKCGGKGLCPISFGVALGITSGLAFFIWSIWVMHYGLPPMMGGHAITVTWGEVFAHGLWGLLKGFVFGFVLALLYDLIICCCRCKCCKGGCGCQTGSTAICKCGCDCCARSNVEPISKM